jgi:hypothetical protein
MQTLNYCFCAFPLFLLRMPWQGDTNNMIDRFDVRAHLDHIPDYTPPLLTTM